MTETIFPIVMFMNVNQWNKDIDGVSGIVTGTEFKHCDFVPHSEIGLMKENDMWKTTKFEFITDSSGMSRPLGKQSFGRWKWYIGNNLEYITEVAIRVSHICNGKLIHTDIGPFVISKFKN